MEENETFETDTLVDEETSSSKTPIVVGVLAAVGGVTLARTVFSKVRGYRIVKKSAPQPQFEAPTPTVES